MGHKLYHITSGQTLSRGRRSATNILSFDRISIFSSPVVPLPACPKAVIWNPSMRRRFLLIPSSRPDVLLGHLISYGHTSNTESDLNWRLKLTQPFFNSKALTPPSLLVVIVENSINWNTFFQSDNLWMRFVAGAATLIEFIGESNG